MPSIQQAINQSIDQPINQSANQPINQSINRIINWPTVIIVTANVPFLAASFRATSTNFGLVKGCWSTCMLRRIWWSSCSSWSEKNRGLPLALTCGLERCLFSVVRGIPYCFDAALILELFCFTARTANLSFSSIFSYIKSKGKADEQRPKSKQTY